jgi:hypothetical protein
MGVEVEQEIREDLDRVLVPEPQVIGSVGIPGGIQMVYSIFARDLAVLMASTECGLMKRGYAVDFSCATSCYVPEARNELVNKFTGNWLFMTDTDHSFAGDTLLRLLDTMFAPEHQGYGGLPVVSGLYFARGKHLPHLYNWNFDTPGKVMTQVVHFTNTEPFTIGCVGAGCLLVQRVVFDRIRDELGREPFSPIEVQGRWIKDDVAFCWNCHELEIPIVCDPRVVSLHLEAHPVGLDDYHRAQQRLGITGGPIDEPGEIAAGAAAGTVGGDGDDDPGDAGGRGPYRPGAAQHPVGRGSHVEGRGHGG